MQDAPVRGPQGMAGDDSQDARMQARQLGTGARNAADPSEAKREAALQKLLGSIEEFARRRMQCGDFGHVTMRLAWKDGVPFTLDVIDPTQTFQLNSPIEDRAGRSELVGQDN